MNSSPQKNKIRPIENRSNGWAAFAEILLIFAVFFVYGAWPVPDVNEQYYIGKAIHFWHPDWLASDNFLGTPDSHWLYYAVFGIFSLVLNPAALAWFGRILIWFLTAWSWRSLSFAIIPRRWVSVLTALGFLFYLDVFHLAGEWIIGGVEGKGFAFPFIFWGLAAFIKGKDRLCWILLGIASAFHVLAGGWTVLAALFAWTVSEYRLNRNFKKVFEQFVRIFPALILGGAISLFGLIPALMLDSGASQEVVRQSHRIYVYERLAHHLVPSSLPWTFVLRFLMLSGIWILFCRIQPEIIRNFWSKKFPCPDSCRKQSKAASDSVNNWSENKNLQTQDTCFNDQKNIISLDRSSKNFYSEKTSGPETASCRINCFVWVSLIFMMIGFSLDFGVRQLSRWGLVSDPKNMADLLRFYWFRLSDWAVPFGVAFGSALLFLRTGNIFLRKTFNNHKKRRDQQSTAIFISWILLSAIVYILYKECFSAIVCRQALAATVDPNYPVPPRPVEAVSIITSLFTCVIGYSVFYFARTYFLMRSQRKFAERNTGKIQNIDQTRSLKNRALDQSESFLGSIRKRRDKIVIISVLFLSGILAFAGPLSAFVNKLSLRTSPVIPRSNPQKESISNGWIQTCRWVRDPENTASDSVFLVPCGYNSFKWYAERAEAAAWKEIPQDARSIDQWYKRVNALYAMPGEKGSARWNQPLVIVLIAKGRNRVLEECKKYRIDYIIIENPPYTLTAYPKAMERWQEFVDNDIVWQNGQFTVLCFKGKYDKNIPGRNALDEKRTKKNQTNETDKNKVEENRSNTK